MACTDCCQPSQSSIKLIALVVWFNFLQNARQLKSSTLIVMGPEVDIDFTCCALSAILSLKKKAGQWMGSSSQKPKQLFMS